MSNAEYEAFRARRQAELAAKASGQPANADEAFEQKKAAVAAQHGQWASGTPKHAIDLDTAAKDDDTVKATHKRLAGGVKKIDKAAADAAYKADAGFAKKPEVEQQATAKGARPAHTTETPGSSHETSMGAALSKAGLSVAPGAGEKAKRSPAPAPSPDVAARNNMGAPRVQDNGHSVVAGRTVDPAAAAAAKAAAGQGGRKNGGVREKAPAAAPVRSKPAPVAPAAVAQSQQLPQGRFASKGHAEMFGHVLGLDHGPSSPLSSRPSTPAAPKGGVRFANHDAGPAPAAPVSNAAPVAPAAQNSAPAPTMTPTSRGRFESTDSVTRESIGAGKPKLGRDITYGVDKATGPTAATRAAYNAHISGGGTTDSYWAQRDARKAGKAAPKAAKPAPAAVSEPPSVAAPKAAPVVSPVAAGIHQSPDPVRPSSPPSTPAIAPWPPSRGRPPEGSGLGLHTKVSAEKAAPRAQATPAAPPAGPPKINPTQAAAASGGAPTPPQTRSTGRVVTEEAPSVRESSPGTRMAARAGGVSGGEGSVNVGGDNHGQITNNHNTYNVNYGHVGGSMGNVEHGYAPRGGGHAGGVGGGGHGGSGGHGGEHSSHGGDLWVRDASGTHSLRGTLDHVTGRTNGHGVKTPQAAKPRSAGGTQNPLAGSARAAGSSVNPAQTPNAGTGTTNNWQGPQGGVTHPASGIGTASHGQNPE